MIIKIKSVLLDFIYPTKIVDISDDYLILANGDYISFDHDQDCCEHNFADFHSLKDTTLIGQNFTSLEFEVVEDYGFKLNGHLVNCYSQQNGYYTNELDIYYNTKGITHKILSLYAPSTDD